MSETQTTELNLWQQANEEHKTVLRAVLTHRDSCEACRNYRECSANDHLMLLLVCSPKYPAGMDVIRAGKCPLGFSLPSACFSCTRGHMTECHFPLTCEQAQCEHKQQSRVAHRPI